MWSDGQFSVLTKILRGMRPSAEAENSSFVTKAGLFEATTDCFGHLRARVDKIFEGFARPRRSRQWRTKFPGGDSTATPMQLSKKLPFIAATFTVVGSIAHSRTISRPDLRHLGAGQIALSANRPSDTQGSASTLTLLRDGHGKPKSCLWAKSAREGAAHGIARCAMGIRAE